MNRGQSVFREEREPLVGRWLGVVVGGGAGGLELSLVVVVAALQVFALNVSSAVVRARQLNAVLVHTPADAPFAAARWFALWTEQQRVRGGRQTMKQAHCKIFIQTVD